MRDQWKGDMSSTFLLWKEPNTWLHPLESEHMGTIWKDIQSKKIIIKQGPDIIIWEHRTIGTFMVNEAYSLLIGRHEVQPPNI